MVGEDDVLYGRRCHCQWCLKKNSVIADVVGCQHEGGSTFILLHSTLCGSRDRTDHVLKWSKVIIVETLG